METIAAFKGTYRFLSNFYPSPLTWQGQQYPSAEHAFQAAKALDPDEELKIRKAATPGEAKQLGGRTTIRSDWEHVKIPIMEAILEAKFRSNPELAQRLLETGNRILIEGNNWGDQFWGVSNGRGENHLGKSLMRVRTQLRAELAHTK